MKGTSIVEQYAAAKGWQLAPNNIVVEGTSDEEFLCLASALYFEKFNKSLLGTDLVVFPVGDADDGGTYGIKEQFPTLYNLADVSLNQHGKRLFRIVTLLDGDSQGKGTAGEILRQNRRLVRWRDVFVLHRQFPMKTVDALGIGKHIDDANAKWKKLDTEIEDLVGKPLSDGFFHANPHYDYDFDEESGQFHTKFPKQAKAPFLRFVKENAILGDVMRLVDILCSMRFFLGLDPKGI